MFVNKQVLIGGQMETGNIACKEHRTVHRGSILLTKGQVVQSAI